MSSAGLQSPRDSQTKTENGRAWAELEIAYKLKEHVSFFFYLQSRVKRLNKKGDKFTSGHWIEQNILMQHKCFSVNTR